MLFFKREINLDNQSIQSTLDEFIESYEHATKKRKQSILNLKLTLEELLLDFQETYGETAICRIVATKRLETVQISLSNKGNTLNPLQLDSQESEMSRYFLDNLGLSPEYTYNHKTGENIVSLSAPLKPIKNKMMKEIIAALALAVVSYFLIRLLPGSAQNLLQTEIVQPVFNKLTSIIATIATPLVFLAVIDGILGVGNTSTLGSIGKKLLSNMLLTFGIAAVAFTIIAPLFYPLTGMSKGSEGKVIGQLVQLVLDIIPDHLLECFVSDNDLQVITLAIFIGIVLLTMNSVKTRVAGVVQALSSIINKMMYIVCKLLPLMVYLGIINMMFNDLSQIASIYKVAIIYLLSVAVVIASLCIRLMLSAKVSPLKLLKAQAKTLMINLTTSSQVAAMPENVDCCKKQFGIDGRFIDFALPISIVTYMPCGAIFLGLTVWGIADISGTPIDLIFMIKIAIVAVIVAIAAPPIPGSAMAVLPILLSSCGMDMEFFSVAIVLATIIGYFLPAFNGYCIQLELLSTAHKLNLVDNSKLDKFRLNKYL